MDQVILSIQIDKESPVPIYNQIASGILEAAEKKIIKPGDKLPSVNKISKLLSVSRETVFKAYHYLTERNVIQSSDRVGYFLKSAMLTSQYKALILLDKINDYKNELLEGFIEIASDNIIYDVYFHHHNAELCRSIIEDKIHEYTHIVVCPFFDKQLTYLNTLPSNKIVIVDWLPDYLNVNTSVVQNFEENIVSGLEQLVKDKLYKTIHFSYPKNIWYEKEINAAAIRLEHKFNIEFKHKIVTPNKGELYLFFDDHSLYQFLHLLKKDGLKPGIDLGVISYNEAAFKELLLENGITTISTDFKEMGRYLAQAILENKKTNFTLATRNYLRASI